MMELPDGFDYAKFAASLVALVVAVLGIAFKYKLVVRSDDPAQPEKERLSKLGVAAIVLVLLGAGFKIYSDARGERGNEAARREALKELVDAQHRQAALNRETDRVLRELRATLADARRASDSAATRKGR